MSDREGALRFFRAAERDIALLDADVTLKIPTEVFGFHAQQAVEKLLKSWLCINDLTFPYTHDLRHLSRLISKSNSDIPLLLKDMLFLTEFAVEFRYSSYGDSNPPLDRSKILSDLTTLRAFIASTIEKTE
jgi:HEPN domain-containing protein